MKKFNRDIVFVDGMKLSKRFYKKLIRRKFNPNSFVESCRRCCCLKCEWSYLKPTDKCDIDIRDTYYKYYEKDKQ